LCMLVWAKLHSSAVLPGFKPVKDSSDVLLSRLGIDLAMVLRFVGL